GVTGIVNIGHSGGVDFTSEGKTVRVNRGEYSVAPAGLPPTQPLVYDAGPGIGGVARAEKIVTLKGAVTGNTAGTVGTTTDAPEKILKTGAGRTVETGEKLAVQAVETIDKTPG